ncbi:MAG: WbqC family protein [Bacteroidales bacterium]|nr:WbqC family protein [Bacteroidales bacterium]MBQ9639914.1 WbqC family protein [Bacteroidales bacterium]
MSTPTAATTPLPYLLLSTAYLPSVAYMACVAQASHVVIEQYETFPKQTLRNRTLIGTPQGSLALSIPLHRPFGNRTRTHEIELNYAEAWPVRHWRTIESAYSAAPFFLYYKDELQRTLLAPHTTLLTLNDALLACLCRRIGINCPIGLSTDFLPPDAACTNGASRDANGGLVGDLRSTITTKHYVAPCPLPPYTQVFTGRQPFLPNLSIIDLLFNLGPETKDYLLSLPLMGD